MKIDEAARGEHLLALSRKQRRFEWELARDEQARTAARLVASRTHDLLNLVQIVQLATYQLEEPCGATYRETLDELTSSAAAAHASLIELMGVARPDQAIVPGAPVGATVANVLATLHTIHDIEVHVTVDAATATRCTAEELEHLLIGLVLDALDDPSIAIHVRERTISAAPWIEIMRITNQPASGDGFDLRAVTAIAARAGGEITTSETREGGSELVVALPVAAV
ncbi:MAG: hypothetical protein H0V17_04570 [Deltaproteobacteria bacterium]|nr:hypothetical protein [Deltaproteobacteria bacterium]